MKASKKYWNKKLRLTQIIINEKEKHIVNDAQHGRLAIVTFDKNIYFVDFLIEKSRYIDYTEERFY